MIQNQGCILRKLHKTVKDTLIVKICVIKQAGECIVDTCYRNVKVCWWYSHRFLQYLEGGKRERQVMYLNRLKREIGHHSLSMATVNGA